MFNNLIIKLNKCNNLNNDQNNNHFNISGRGIQQEDTTVLFFPLIGCCRSELYFDPCYPLCSFRPEKHHSWTEHHSAMSSSKQQHHSYRVEQS